MFFPKWTIIVIILKENAKLVELESTYFHLGIFKLLSSLAAKNQVINQ